MGINDDFDLQKKTSLLVTIFLMALCLVFVIAKIAGAITWGWIMVFSPVLFPFAFGVILMVLGYKPPME